MKSRLNLMNALDWPTRRPNPMATMELKTTPDAASFSAPTEQFSASNSRIRTSYAKVRNSRSHIGCRETMGRRAVASAGSIGIDLDTPSDHRPIGHISLTSSQQSNGRQVGSVTKTLSNPVLPVDNGL